MYDQTQTHQPSGMGGMSSGQGFGVGGMDSGQSDEANASRRLRVRVAGTALFTVGLAAMGYSMVDKSMGGDEPTDGKASTGDSKLEVNPAVRAELPKDDFDYITDPNLNINGGVAPTPVPVPIPTPVPGPTPSPVVIIAHDHDNSMHDFSSCGSFSQAFAHARAELGGPGEIFIYQGKPYTTTYKHEADAGQGHTHLDRGFEVEMVVREFEDGSKVIASDTDKDGKADRWYYEDNESRSELLDFDGDGNFDSYTDSDGVLHQLESQVSTSEGEIEMPPSPVYDIITVDGVEFLAYGQEGNYNELIGGVDGQIVYYQDVDGDGKFEHAEILDENFQTLREWEIKPVSIQELDVQIPASTESDPAGQSSDITKDPRDPSFVGPEEEEPIIDENDEQALNDDPYRIDAEEEILSGDLNNHADMSAFGN
jgi:hypothetical protein